MNLIPFRNKNTPTRDTGPIKPASSLSDIKRGELMASIKRHEESIAHRTKMIEALIADQKDEMLVLASERAGEARINAPLIELAAAKLDAELNLDAAFSDLPDISTAIADAPEEMREAAE